MVHCLSDVQCVSDVIKKKKKFTSQHLRKNFLAVLTVHRRDTCLADLLSFWSYSSRGHWISYGAASEGIMHEVRAGPNDLWVLRSSLGSSDLTFFTVVRYLLPRYYPSCASYVLRLVIDLKKIKKAWSDFLFVLLLFFPSPVLFIVSQIRRLGRILRGENRN